MTHRHRFPFGQASNQNISLGKYGAGAATTETPPSLPAVYPSWMFQGENFYQGNQLATGFAITPLPQTFEMPPPPIFCPNQTGISYPYPSQVINPRHSFPTYFDTNANSSYHPWNLDEQTASIGESPNLNISSEATGAHSATARPRISARSVHYKVYENQSFKEVHDRNTDGNSSQLKPSRSNAQNCREVRSTETSDDDFGSTANSDNSGNKERERTYKGNWRLGQNKEDTHNKTNYSGRKSDEFASTANSDCSRNKEREKTFRGNWRRGHNAEDTRSETNYSGRKSDNKNWRSREITNEQGNWRSKKAENNASKVGSITPVQQTNINSQCNREVRRTEQCNREVRRTEKDSEVRYFPNQKDTQMKEGKHCMKSCNQRNSKTVNQNQQSLAGKNQRKTARSGSNQGQPDMALAFKNLQIGKQPVDTDKVVLDEYNSDLHLKIGRDGYSACNLNIPEGFRLLWAGGRANYGVWTGKVCFETKITQLLPTEAKYQLKEAYSNLLRVGWSTDSSSFQLGEDDMSYGYGGSGWKSCNNRFDEYGFEFGEGDVIGALLDLESKPATISFTRNGQWLGTAFTLLPSDAGTKENALFPHILCKNCLVEVNFGQLEAWYPPHEDYQFIGHLPQHQRVRGQMSPRAKRECQVIMIIGLPGSGKTTWAETQKREYPDKRFNILGTDALVNQMRAKGLKRDTYSARFEQLYDSAEGCFNELLRIASTRKRNYILDQTNTAQTARRRKLAPFNGFHKTAVVVQPSPQELDRRARQRTELSGKEVPHPVVRRMKNGFRLPTEREGLFDNIVYAELKKKEVERIVQRYNHKQQ